jgi:hypothetical protein
MQYISVFLCGRNPATLRKKHPRHQKCFAANRNVSGYSEREPDAVLGAGNNFPKSRRTKSSIAKAQIFQNKLRR